MENYEPIRVVGKGSYGEVTLVRDRREKKRYVVKKLKLENVSRRERKAAEQEAQLLSQLKHPNIVMYRESWEREDGILYIVMGFCEGGDLYHRLKEQQGQLLPESQVVEWFVQIAMALQYLHEKHILHRDLKTQNIFLTRTSIIKVGDLGIAKVLESKHDMASTLIGTPYYMSPELFSNQLYNHKSDVWALGCCAYEMATLKHAFNAKDMNSLVYRIIEGKLSSLPKCYSPPLGELIKNMLSKRPEERPDVRSILRQPFIKHHISIFLAATKAKAVRTRKKSVESKANGVETAKSDVETNKVKNRPTKSVSEPPRKPKKNEEKNYQNSKVSNACQEGKSSFSKLSAGEETFNNSGISVATISKVDIDIQPIAESENSKRDDPVLGEPVRPKGASSKEHLRRQPQKPLPQNGTKPVTKALVYQISAGLDDKEDTMQLLQPVISGGESELQGDLDSTEKLLQPFEPVALLEELPVRDPATREKRHPILHPSSSSSEPSHSRQSKQKGREKNAEKQKPVTEPKRSLPERPCSENKLPLMKSNSSADEHCDEISRSVAQSKDSGVASSQERPLSARERRRLKHSQEDLYPVVSPRRDSHDGRPSVENEHTTIHHSSSDSNILCGKGKKNFFCHVSEEESELSSSTSSTDRSEGDSKDGKGDFTEMHDLVQLMTQTLKMEFEEKCIKQPNSIPMPKAKPNRKYRDTLILHGKAKEEPPEEFCFRSFPSEDAGAPERIRRIVEALRVDVVKGLGVKLLEKVYEILEQDDTKWEQHLLTQMGPDKYRDYGMKVRQLKFFEDNGQF
ncbi:serine/threonine-protein kinase Nek4 [Protopterus annectens]|uniref:serine/threonine-protein kinase Nek4 n=1 Tax=Protopterus annectens TaxID=7888 RepID=UPI001CFA40FB|nr:serine/threonine-protein kinase Nek4 [Protopterus annectens]